MDNVNVYGFNPGGGLASVWTDAHGCGGGGLVRGQDEGGQHQGRLLRRGGGEGVSL